MRRDTDPSSAVQASPTASEHRCPRCAAGRIPADPGAALRVQPGASRPASQRHGWRGAAAGSALAGLRPRGYPVGEQVTFPEALGYEMMGMGQLGPGAAPGLRLKTGAPFAIPDPGGERKLNLAALLEHPLIISASQADLLRSPERAEGNL